jgi:hypothetical protein
MSSLLAWFGVWCLTTGWLLLTNFFVAADERGWAFVGAGLILTAISARRVRWRQFDRWYCLLALPGGVAALAWPWPYKIGPLFLLGGLLLALPLALASESRSRPMRWLTPLAIGLGLAGLIWTAQGGATVAYWWLSARYHEAPLLTTLFFALARALGWRVASSQGSLLIPHIEGIVQAATTWERLGAYPALLLAAGGVALLPLVQSRNVWHLVRRLGAAGGLLAAYVVIRYLVLTAVAAITRDPTMFWAPPMVALSFLPLIPILALALPLRRALAEVVPQAQPARSGRYLALAGLAFLGGLAIAGVLTFPDLGRQKAGRVLLDEYNSNWEWTTQALDTEWYGQKSGYNYYSLGQWLGYYYDVETNFQPRTAELLDGYDVLIIKTPTAPFATQEIEAIEAWVRGGGGLFLIGDHTNVFGTSSYLNPLAERFGLHFRYDSTYDLATLRVSLYEPPHLLGHPAVTAMPPFLFATSCTLEAPLLGENVMVGYGLRALPVDYGRRMFFPDKEQEQDYPFGLFLQSAGVGHGRGRVLAFTDSTVFSNFTMFLGGKPEFFLGAMNWLNYAERWPWLDGALLLVAALVAGGSIYLAQGLSMRRAGIVVLGALLLALAIGPWASRQLAQRRYQPPEPHTAYTTIAFEAEHSRMELPTRPVPSPPELSYQTFYVWTQRLGYVPTHAPTLSEALQRGQVLVLINPVKPLSAEEMAALTSYVQGGGRVLLLVDPQQTAAPAEIGSQILAPFGLGLEARETTTGAIHNSAGQAVGILPVSGVITGGEPLLTLESRATVLGLARHGEGLVAAAAFARPFSDGQMGNTAVVPNEHQRFLFETEYWLFRSLVSGAFPPLQVPGEAGD